MVLFFRRLAEDFDVQIYRNSGNERLSGNHKYQCRCIHIIVRLRLLYAICTRKAIPKNISESSPLERLA